MLEMNDDRLNGTAPLNQAFEHPLELASACHQDLESLWVILAAAKALVYSRLLECDPGQLIRFRYHIAECCTVIGIVMKAAAPTIQLLALVVTNTTLQPNS